MLAKVYSGAVVGVDAAPVEIEVNSGGGGEINQVMPTTTTRETAQAHAKRSRQRGFMLQKEGNGNWKKALLGVVILLAVLFVAALVTRFVYASQVSAKMHMDDPELAQVLVAPETSRDTGITIFLKTIPKPSPKRLRRLV